MAATGSLDGVVSRQFTTRDFPLMSGQVLPELTLAYEAYGTVTPNGRNAVLLTHGFTSSHHAAGRYRKGGAAAGLKDDEAGTWDSLIGPARPIDTNKLFVVSSNMLGSSYGSTSPRSTNPATGRPYGPDFPRITVADIVNAQKALLDHLGVTHLVAVAGPSYGGFQAFQWAVSYPDFMHGIVPVVTSPFSTTTAADTQALIKRLSADPNWNGGRYYDTGGIPTAMMAIRVATLKSYGLVEQLRERRPIPDDIDAAIIEAARPWVEAFDGNSMVVLRRALEGFDVTPQFAKVKARVLYVICRTDKLFPPDIVPDVMHRMKAAGIDAQYFEIDSELGHLASGPEADKWGPSLARFMAELISKG